MTITIMEVLQNAEYNLKNAVIPMQTKMGIDQLSNVNYLLNELGKDLLDDFNECDLEDKPEK